MWKSIVVKSSFHIITECRIVRTRNWFGIIKCSLSCYNQGVNRKFYHDMRLQITKSATTWFLFDLTQSLTFISTHKKQLKYDLHNIMTELFSGFRHLNRKQSINKNKALFRKVCINGKRWHRHGNFKIKTYLSDGGDMNLCFHFASILLDRWSLNLYIDPDQYIVTPLVIRPDDFLLYYVSPYNMMLM